MPVRRDSGPIATASCSSWLTPTRFANLKDRVRFSIATDRIRNDQERLNQFPPEVRKKITALADEASLNTLVALARCYSHLYYPIQDAQHSHLRHYEMPPKDKGAVPDKLTKTVVQALRDEGKIRDTKPATDYLRQKAWQPKDAPEMLVSGIADYFWQDHSMALILDPNLLKEAIRDGVANGSWVYFDPERQQAWTSGDAAPPVALDGGALLYTPERAEELKLLRKPVRIDDVVGAVTEKATGPRICGKHSKLRWDTSQARRRSPRPSRVQYPGCHRLW